jgi:hypothetical protein
MKTNRDQRQKYTLMNKYKKIWPQIKAKTKTKSSSRKRRTLGFWLEWKLERSWQMKSKATFPKQICWGPTIYCSKQTKLITKTKTTNAPRKTHSAWSNKNIVSWKVTWFLPMKKGYLGGIPKLWRLYFLDISWGDAWASPRLSFCPFFNSSHHSPIPTLENFLHTKLNTNLLAILV